MPLEDICVHRATVKRTERTGEKVEGEWEEAAVDGQTFDCILFPPEPGPEQNLLRRVILVPTLLHYAEDVAGAPLTLSKDEEVDVTVIGIPAKWGGRWQVDGEPQPFGPPGAAPVGELATLKRVGE